MWAVNFGNWTRSRLDETTCRCGLATVHPLVAHFSRDIYRQGDIQTAKGSTRESASGRYCRKRARYFWRTVIPFAEGIRRRRLAMMGRQTGDQSQLFYLFNLERRIPTVHLLRWINPVVTRIASVQERAITALATIGL
jgi:hypothetical protein